MTRDFEDLEAYWQAIRDLDRLSSRTDEEDKIAECFNIVKNINMASINPTIVNNIITSFREGILEMYVAKMGNVNDTINLNRNSETKAEELFHIARKELEACNKKKTV